MSGNKRISELPIYDRPREKALRFGVDSLNNAEIIALILGSGIKNHSVIDISSQLLTKHKGLINLSQITDVEMLLAPGINKSRGLILLAVFALIRRIKNSNTLTIVNDISELAEKYLYDFSSAHKEMLSLIILDKNKAIMKERLLYVGTSQGFEIDTKELIDLLIISKAHSFVLIHNHPSGNAFPSEEDINATKQISFLTAAKNIKLFDHLIIANYNYFSFRANELID